MARRRRAPQLAMGRRRPPYRKLDRDPLGGPDSAPGTTTATVRGQAIRLTPAQRAAWTRQMAARARPSGPATTDVRTGHSGIPRVSVGPTPSGGAAAASGAALGGKGATPDPYAGLDPALAQSLRQIDWEQRQHQQYLGFGPSGTPLLGPDGQQSGVMGWLAGATKALGGISAAAGQNYNEQITRGVGGAAASAAGAQTPSVGGRGPGGTYSPTEYESEGQRDLARSRGAAAQDMVAWQSMLETKLNVVRNQASLDAMADYAAGLPAVYAKKRLDTRMEMEKYLADLKIRQLQAEETARHNQVTEAQGAQNAMTNAAVAFGKLGISADKVALDAAGNPDASNGGTEPLPAGYVWAKNSKGGYDRVRDPSFSTSGAGGSAAKPQTTLLEEKLRKEGWTKLGPGRDPKKIDRTKFKVVKASDSGALMVIRRTGTGTGSSGSTAKVKSTPQLSGDLEKLYSSIDSDTNIESRHEGDPVGAAGEVADWVLSNKGSFTNAAGKVDMAKIRQVVMNGIGNQALTSPVLKAVLTRLAQSIGPNGKWR